MPSFVLLAFSQHKFNKSLTPLFETRIKLPHGMIIIEHMFCPCPNDARLVANVWLCVTSWHYVTMVDFN
jgi:hypothetical protein